MTLYACFDNGIYCCGDCAHPTRAQLDLAAARKRAYIAALAKLTEAERTLLGLPMVSET